MTRFTVVFAGVLDGKRLEDFTIDGATAVAYWDGDAIRQQVCFQDFIAEIDDLNGKIEDLSAENARLREALEKIAALDVPPSVMTRYRADEQSPKNDICPHLLAMSEDCPDCVADYARAALAEKEK